MTASTPSQQRKQRILLIAEAVTLAHLARPLTLGGSLPTDRYDVQFACTPRYNGFLGDLKSPAAPIETLSSEAFMLALKTGQPLYDANTLSAYVEEDIKLFEQFSPDLVVGDFRLSLSVSARLAKIPYISISSIYWSPYADLRFPLPELPIVQALGPTLTEPLFRMVRPFAFALHTRPLNTVRRKFGLPSLGWDLRRTYTDADITLYTDIAEMFPTRDQPANHRFIGSVQWQPPEPPPGWWDELSRDLPWVFVTLGSSGPANLLPMVLDALAEFPVQVIAASAGRVSPRNIPENAKVEKFLPGVDAAARSALVICNGGSPVTQLALTNGVPTLGICSNMDQYLNMEAVQRANAGLLLRAGTATHQGIHDAVVQLLDSPQAHQAAATLQSAFARYSATDLFRQAIEDLTTA